VSDFDISVQVDWKPEDIQASLLYAVRRTVGETAKGVKDKIDDKLSRADNSGMMNPARSGQPPKMVTGALRNSWNVDYGGLNNENPSALVISNLAYAKILEYGSIEMGRIKPKTKQFLTIPLNEEAGRLRRRTKDLRSVRGLFVVKEKGERTKKGKRKKGKKGRDYLILAFSVGKGRTAKIKPMFLLVKSVYIKKHPYIRPVVKKLAEGRSQEKFGRKIGNYFFDHLMATGMGK